MADLLGGNLADIVRRSGSPNWHPASRGRLPSPGRVPRDAADLTRGPLTRTCSRRLAHEDLLTRTCSQGPGQQECNGRPPRADNPPRDRHDVFQLRKCPGVSQAFGRPSGNHDDHSPSNRARFPDAACQLEAVAATAPVANPRTGDPPWRGPAQYRNDPCNRDNCHRRRSEKTPSRRGRPRERAQAGGQIDSHATVGLGTGNAARAQWCGQRKRRGHQKQRS